MSVPPSDAEDSHLLDGPDTPAKANAPKNKECPFCGEKFTSSSLGRHLDLYIKEKNPKAPDGLHDVDRIRQIRSHITRRQPRKGTKQHTVSTPGSNVDGHVNTTASAYGYTIGTDKDNRILINRPTWEATGVITDIPTTPGASLNLTSRKQISRTNMVLKKRMVEDRTRLRAAELALQEILDSVNAASLSTESAPFDFDFFGQTFPALCIKLLPPQPMINSAQVIENPKCCPISAPGKAHLDLLRNHVRQRLEAFKTQRAHTLDLLSKVQEYSATSSAVKEPEQEEHDPISYHNHLTQAWELWKSTPESQKATQWHLEAFRAISGADSEHTKLSDSLAKAKGEVAQLRLQIDRLNECQQPKEYTYNIPSYHNIDPASNKELVTKAADVSLNREVLIEKWTTIVKENSKLQRALPEFELLDTGIDEVEGIDLGDRYDGNGVGHDGDDDGDSIDAAGEDDDEVVSHRNSNSNIVNGALTLGAGSAARVASAFLDRDVLDPSLRNDPDSSMEVDGGDFGGESLLAGMRAREQRAGDHGL